MSCLTCFDFRYLFIYERVQSVNLFSLNDDTLGRSSEEDLYILLMFATEQSDLIMLC